MRRVTAHGFVEPDTDIAIRPPLGDADRWSVHFAHDRITALTVRFARVDDLRRLGDAITNALMAAQRSTPTPPPWTPSEPFGVVIPPEGGKR